MSTKTKFFNLCFKKCYETLQQYRVSKSDKVMKQLDWTYTKMQEQKADIKAILDELDVITPEEYDTYLQMDKAEYHLEEFMTAAFKDIAIEIRGAELKAKEEARLKAEAEAELRAEEEAKLKAEAEAETKLKDSKSSANAQIQSLDERSNKLKQEWEIWHELIKRMNGKLTAHQTMKIMELESKITALHREATAVKQAQDEEKLRAETKDEERRQSSGTPPESPRPEPPGPEPPRPEPPRPEPPKSGQPRPGLPRPDPPRPGPTRPELPRPDTPKPELPRLE